MLLDPGPRMRAIRQFRGISGREAAAFAATTAAHLSNFERGLRGEPGRHIMERLAILYNVPLMLLTAPNVHASDHLAFLQKLCASRKPPWEALADALGVSTELLRKITTDNDPEESLANAFGLPSDFFALGRLAILRYLLGIEPEKAEEICEGLNKPIS